MQNKKQKSKIVWFDPLLTTVPSVIDLQKKSEMKNLAALALRFLRNLRGL